MSKREAGVYAILETTMGRMVCRLFADKAPRTVENFIELAEGRSVEEVLKKRPTVTEGVYTASALVEMAAAKGIDMPIAQAVHAVVSGRVGVDEAIEALLSRPLRAET